MSAKQLVCKKRNKIKHLCIFVQRCFQRVKKLRNVILRSRLRRRRIFCKTLKIQHFRSERHAESSCPTDSSLALRMTKMIVFRQSHTSAFSCRGVFASSSILSCIFLLQKVICENYHNLSLCKPKQHFCTGKNFVCRHAIFWHNCNIFRNTRIFACAQICA